MTLTIADGIGLIGAGLIVVAYALLQSGRWTAMSVRFSLANAIGAAGIIFALLSDFNLSAFVIEIFWFSISVFGVIQALRRRSRATAD
ncbi:MAG: hypothetical protein AAGC71_06395 [Pseudomonadota bacterium]